MNVINIIAYTQDPDQIEAVTARLNAFKIKFKITKPKEDALNYNPEFVAKIRQGDKDLAEGKGKKITTEELNALWK
jgi:hypothetical protein